MRTWHWTPLFDGKSFITQFKHLRLVMVLIGCEVKYMTFARECLLCRNNNEPTGPLNHEYTGTHGVKKYYFVAAVAEKKGKKWNFSIQEIHRKGI